MSEPWDPGTYEELYKKWADAVRDYTKSRPAIGASPCHKCGKMCTWGWCSETCMFGRPSLYSRGLLEGHPWDTTIVADDISQEMAMYNKQPKYTKLPLQSCMETAFRNMGHKQTASV